MERTLGPRNVGDILKETFIIYKNNIWRLVAIGSVAAVPGAVIGTLPQLLSPRYSMVENLNPAILLILIPLYLIIFAVSVFAMGAVIFAVAEQYFKRPVSIRRAFSFSWNRLSDMFWALVLVVLAVWGIVAAAFLISLPLVINADLDANPILSILLLMIVMVIAFFIALLPITYLNVRWIFGTQSALLQGLGPVAALKNSWQLVKENWWRVFGILLLLGLILWAAMMVIMVPVVFGTMGATLTSYTTETAAGLPIWLLVWMFVASLIVNLFGTPIINVGETLLYFDLRVRKQGYTFEKLAGELGLPSTATDSAVSP
ncbi:MAG TPA: hypothetical protein VF366_04965 [Dehalococcoidia bacterium]